MTAILLTPAQFEGLRAAILADYRQRGLDPYWLPMPVAVTAEKHAGMVAIDAGKESLGMGMINGKTLEELPEYTAMLAMLGDPQPVELSEGDFAKPNFKL